MPVEGVDAGGVTLSFVFSVSTIVLFGWPAGVLVAFAAPAITQLFDRPPVRVAYNAATFALGAGVAGLAAGAVGGEGAGSTVARVAVCAASQSAVNLVLVGSVVARSSRLPFLASTGSSVRWTFLTFVFMGSAALALVVLWQASPFVSVALAGPLLAIVLYQRSTYRVLRALRLASTDPVTGVGNHRYFHERLERALETAGARGACLSVCLLDLDDFKWINDRFGHPAGDRVLARLAGCLRQDGEAFRLGGDEFAVILPGHDDRQALAAARAIAERIRALRPEEGINPITVSAGVASFPAQATGRDELIRLADNALYLAKEHGKDRVWAHRPEMVEFGRLADGGDRAARRRAAASLAKAVDERDAYTGSHSERVAELCARIAARMGLGREDTEVVRLAGKLHDLGKLALPEEILRKVSPLTESERRVLERHPQIGFRMLEGLHISPVDAFVLHHHERWDGKGYPDGLAGDRIPLGARIIFVADAFDAITSDRAYGRRLSPQEAVRELERCAGTQFDPGVVSALARAVGLAPEGVGAALAS